MSSHNLTSVHMYPCLSLLHLLRTSVIVDYGPSLVTSSNLNLKTLSPNIYELVIGGGGTHFSPQEALLDSHNYNVHVLPEKPVSFVMKLSKTCSRAGEARDRGREVEQLQLRLQAHTK